MSNPNPPSKGLNANVVVLAVTAIVCFGIAACVAIVFAVPDGANTGSLITLILAPVGAAVALLAAFLKVSGNIADNAAAAKEVALQTKDNTDRLLNGEMEAKIRAALVKVLDERLAE